MKLADKLMIFYYFFLVIKYQKDDILKQKYHENYPELVELFEAVTEDGSLEFDGVFDEDFVIRCESQNTCLKLTLTLPLCFIAAYKALLARDRRVLTADEADEEYDEIFEKMTFFTIETRVDITIVK